MLLISHDRALLDAVGSRTIAVEDRALRSYVGGWPEYLRVRQERAQDERTAKRAKPPKAAPPPPAAAAGPSKNQRRQAERLEKEIERAEATLKALEEELADPAAWSSPDKSAKSTRRHERAKSEVERLYAQLEAVAG